MSFKSKFRRKKDRKKNLRLKKQSSWQEATIKTNGERLSFQVLLSQTLLKLIDLQANPRSNIIKQTKTTERKRLMKRECLLKWLRWLLRLTTLKKLA